MRIDFQNAILLVLCLALFLSVLSLSALAYSKPPRIPVVTSSTLASDGLLVDTDGLTIGVYSDVPVYACYGATSGSSPLYLASQVNGATVYLNRNGNISSYTCTNPHAATGLYYLHLVSVSASHKNNDIPSYSSLNNSMAAILDSINNPETPPATPVSFDYSLPPGNVAYIEMGSSSAIKLSMDFPELSNSFGTPFSKANSAYALVDSLPSLGSSVTSGTIIPWAKSGRLNLIGQTSEASFGPVGPIATRYVAVINPSYYDHVLVTGTYRQNPPIQIEALNVLSIQVYPLQSDFTFNNDTGQVSTTIAGDAYTGDVDSETGDIYWTDPSGGTSAPPLGGNNLPEAGNSIFDTLRNIASDFSEFLKGPVSAIRVVVSSIRDFMSSFTQLYTWLPSPVYNLITSALMIALTIGVIKIFV